MGVAPAQKGTASAPEERRGALDVLEPDLERGIRRDRQLREVPSSWGPIREKKKVRFEPRFQPYRFALSGRLGLRMTGGIAATGGIGASGFLGLMTVEGRLVGMAQS